MLHELVHRKNYLSGIDDTKHNAAFMNAANAAGLISIYENDEQIEEYLDKFTLFKLGNITYKY